MNDRFLNWGDHGKPKSGKIIGRWQPIESASSRYCKRQFVMKNNSGDWSQSESAKYFELLIVLIITWTNCGRWEQLFHWFKNILAWKWDLSMVYLIGNRLHGQYSTIDQPHFQTVAVYSRVNFRNGVHGDAKTKLLNFWFKWNRRIARISKTSGAPNENIVQNHLNIVLLNVF